MLFPSSHTIGVEKNFSIELVGVDAVSPTTVLGEDADISHAPAGSLTLSQREKRRRVVYQCSVFYTIHFLTRRGGATAEHAFVSVDPLHAVDLALASHS